MKLKPFANLLERLQHYSDWHQAKRAVALCLRLQRRFKRKGDKQKNTVIKTPQEQKGAAHLDLVSVEELRLTEIEVVKAIQKEAFPQETILLQTVKSNQERKTYEERRTYEENQPYLTSRSLYG